MKTGDKRKTPTRLLDECSGQAPPNQISDDLPEGFRTKEEFYNHFLFVWSRRKPPDVEDPGQWYQLLDVNAAEALLPISLHHRPLDFFSSGSRDLLSARRCLELHMARGVDLARRGIHTGYPADHSRPGHMALVWLLDRYDEADLRNNPGFLRAMVHCLVAEGGEHVIWDWLKTAYTPEVLMSLRILEERSLWRGRVLQNLVESQAYWTEGAEGINSCLRSFEHVWSFAVRDLPSGGRIHNPLLVPKSPAGLWITNQLLFNSASSIADPERYDRFIALLPRWLEGREATEFARAELTREHPTKASGLEAFEFIRRYHAVQPRHPFVRDLLKASTGFHFLVNSAQHLHREGHKAEARFMLDVGRVEQRHRFAKKPPAFGAKPDVILGFETRRDAHRRSMYSSH